VPTTFDVRKILNYLYENLGVKKSIIDPQRDNHDATDHLILAIQLPNGRAEQPYVTLDNRLTLMTLFNHIIYLYDEKVQQTLLDDPNSQPYINLTFCKKVNF